MNSLIGMLFRPKRYTLGSFIPRKNNQLARAAGINFIHALRAMPDTMVIAGYPGSGKTHLLNALVRLGMQNENIASLVCLTASQLSNEVILGNFYGDLDIVIDQFVHVGLLAIDDLEQTLIYPEVADVFLAIMRLRKNTKNRTLLTSTLYPEAGRCHPIFDFLDSQAVVRLT